MSEREPEWITMQKYCGCTARICDGSVRTVTLCETHATNVPRGSPPEARIRTFPPDAGLSPGHVTASWAIRFAQQCEEFSVMPPDRLTVAEVRNQLDGTWPPPERPEPTPSVPICKACDGTGFYCRQPCCCAHKCPKCKGTGRAIAVLAPRGLCLPVGDRDTAEIEGQNRQEAAEAQGSGTRVGENVPPHLVK